MFQWDPSKTTLSHHHICSCPSSWHLEIFYLSQIQMYRKDISSLLRKFWHFHIHAQCLHTKSTFRYCTFIESNLKKCIKQIRTLQKSLHNLYLQYWKWSKHSIGNWHYMWKSISCIWLNNLAREISVFFICIFTSSMIFETLTALVLEEWLWSTNFVSMHSPFESLVIAQSLQLSDFLLSQCQ